ncbi:ABC transporter substrate-binding protein [Gephyromycinifex aptenodytis]|uniref:ABC transporter substrate-binding protein n=1 Tax=Gephyromycinifex aptenodytis TaxID=2716227 RepID=UPI00144501FA|nr:ABC transporter substrate-binding protein [Gephyromycinifex aptenodytis]
MNRSTTRLGSTAAVIALSLGLAACGGGSDPLNEESSGSGEAAAAQSIIVGSADFSESKLLANLYRGALEAAGVKVGEPRLGIGAREAYLKGLEDGSINLIPEYTGALALHYDKAFDKTEPQEVYDSLTKSLPENLTVLEPSKAEDKDSITVTKAVADKYSLTKISDLKPVANKLSIGAQAEFQSRAQGAPGLAKTYGITFKQVRSLGGQALVQALTNGQVDAANIFTTDPAIAEHNLIVLEDDKGLFGAQNIVPLLTKKAAEDTTVVQTLNKVSAELSTEDLQTMLKKVDIDKKDPSAVAEEFLSEHGLN